MSTQSSVADAMRTMTSINEVLASAVNLPAKVELLRSMVEQLEARLDDDVKSTIVSESAADDAGEVVQGNASSSPEPHGVEAAEAINSGEATNSGEASSSANDHETHAYDDNPDEPTTAVNGDLLATMTNLDVLKAGLSNAEVEMLNVQTAIAEAMEDKNPEQTLPARPVTPTGPRHSEVAETLEVFGRDGFPLSPPFIVNWKKRAQEAEGEVLDLEVKVEDLKQEVGKLKEEVLELKVQRLNGWAQRFANVLPGPAGMPVQPPAPASVPAIPVHVPATVAPFQASVQDAENEDDDA